ncbi:MAG TPA: hypothetical protein VGK58_15040 [Lacipirellulaceae bacterium]
MNLHRIRRLTNLLGRIVAISLLGWSILCTSAAAQLPFFSGAEGFGGTFSGAAPPVGWFSNATVYHVTNLNDSGPGSLRGAFVQNTANKIIVFDVGGTIQLTGAALDIKNLSNFYIAGQTAPSPVTVYGNTTQITHSADRINSNVVLRYLTFRKGIGNGEDSITFSGGSGPGDLVASNLILDHVSASWSEDEILSVANNNTNVTVQYSIISDALVSNHAYGSLIRPQVDSNVSFHHNLYAHNASRQARFGTYNAETLSADFRNNVIYNWRDRTSYAGGSSDEEREFADVNYVGNYLIAGPGTTGNTTRAFSVDQNIDTRVFQHGNFIDSDRSLNPGGTPNGANTGWGMFFVSPPPSQNPQRVGTLTQMAAPFATVPVTTQSAIDAYHQVLAHVGNYWWSRDAIDSRVVNNVRTNTGPPIAAAAPIASELNSVLTAPMTTRPSGWDTDNDGMPNVWEVAHGLNPNSNLDFNLDFDNDGYINLLEYLDQAGAFPAPGPIVFTGGTNNRYAQITNWKTNDGRISAGSHWQPSRFDEAQINAGNVVVDAVGQHAGTLRVGALPGSNAVLNIANGRLSVEGELAIGSTGASAAVNLSGGQLSAPVLNKHDASFFNLTGGLLQADTVNFDLTIEGGTFAALPGDDRTVVNGHLAIASGALQIRLSSSSVADMFEVHGDATLGGHLDVLPLNGYSPADGDNWQIIAAENILGSFSSISLGYNVRQEGNGLRLFFGATPAPLAGDYNDNGVVDPADYVIWRKALVSGTELPNETESLGTVDHEDYAAWRANFGATQSTESARGAAVPEPSVWAVILLLLVRQIGPRRARL